MQALVTWQYYDLRGRVLEDDLVFGRLLGVANACRAGKGRLTHDIAVASVGVCVWVLGSIFLLPVSDVISYLCLYRCLSAAIYRREALC